MWMGRARQSPRERFAARLFRVSPLYRRVSSLVPAESAVRLRAPHGPRTTVRRALGECGFAGAAPPGRSNVRAGPTGTTPPFGARPSASETDLSPGSRTRPPALPTYEFVERWMVTHARSRSPPSRRGRSPPSRLLQAARLHADRHGEASSDQALDARYPDRRGRAREVHRRERATLGRRQVAVAPDARNRPLGLLPGCFTYVEPQHTWRSGRPASGPPGSQGQKEHPRRALRADRPDSPFMSRPGSGS